MNKVYEVITERFLKLLDNGVIPWKRPWKPGDLPRNLRGSHYRGSNTFVLFSEQEVKGYESNTWLTFNQAQERGGNVRKGEKSTPVIFASRFMAKDKTADGEEIVKSKFSLRYYNVFNTEQIEGVEFPKRGVEALPELPPIESAEQVLKNMPSLPTIKHGGNRAYYSRRDDHVQMPPRKTFHNPEGYYAVLFHELSHSTGHASRLGRFVETDPGIFGGTEYSKEELIAEMSAAFVCGATGIEMDATNSAAYIQSWLKVLKDDKTMVVRAAAAAQKSADYILNVKPFESSEEQGV